MFFNQTLPCPFSFINTAKRHKRGSDLQSDRRFRATRSMNSRMGCRTGQRIALQPPVVRDGRAWSLVGLRYSIIHSISFLSYAVPSRPQRINLQHPCYQFPLVYSPVLYYQVLPPKSTVQPLSSLPHRPKLRHVRCPQSIFAAPAACIIARSWVRKGPEKCKAATPGQCHCTQAAMMRLYPVSNLPLRYACPPCLVVVRGRAAAPRLLVVV